MQRERPLAEVPLLLQVAVRRPPRMLTVAADRARPRRRARVSVVTSLWRLRAPYFFAPYHASAWSRPARAPAARLGAPARGGGRRAGGSGPSTARGDGRRAPPDGGESKAGRASAAQPLADAPACAAISPSRSAARVGDEHGRAEISFSPQLTAAPGARAAARGAAPARARQARQGGSRTPTRCEPGNDSTWDSFMTVVRGAS